MREEEEEEEEEEEDEEEEGEEEGDEEEEEQEEEEEEEDAEKKIGSMTEILRPKFLVSLPCASVRSENSSGSTFSSLARVTIIIIHTINGFDWSDRG